MKTLSDKVLDWLTPFRFIFLAVLLFVLALSWQLTQSTKCRNKGGTYLNGKCLNVQEIPL